MAFKCDKCGAAQESGTKPIRSITKKRRKSYMGGGAGWEIAKEDRLCLPCSKSQAEAVWVTE